jgi:uncharacterized membrane protein YfcA
MSSIAFVLLFFGALAGGFVSGLAGFGTALMTLGIWLYVLPPAVAVPLVLICSIVAQTSTLRAIWRSIDFKLVWPFLVGGLAGVPLGTMLIAHADPRIFKLSVGVLLLVFRPRYISTAPRLPGASAAGSQTLPSDLRAESSAASPACPARSRYYGQACAAGARTNGAAFSRSSTGPYYRRHCACRRAPDLSPGK